MAFAHGKTCEVAVNEFDMTEFFRSMTLAATVDTAESTTFRKDWKTFEEGLATSSAELEGLYDTDRTEDVHDLLQTATPFLATIGPAGLGVGSLSRMLEVNTTAQNTTAGIADVVLLSWSLQTTGELSSGWSLALPTTAHTGDHSGAAVDTGAAVTGALWVAHFHLFDIDATSVTLVVQDSADGTTDWQPITGVTSGSLTAADSVRVTGTGNTRRYVRASADFTGGNTSGSFHISFARKAA